MISDLLRQKLEDLRKDGKKIGLCHGCFDIVHYGHIIHFKEAKSMVDYLIVSVTSEKYVNKGPDRPIFCDQERVEVLSSIKYIDEVITSTSETAINIMREISFDIYIKGPDYRFSKDPRLKAEIEYAHKRASVYYTSGIKYSSSKLAKILMKNDQTL